MAETKAPQAEKKITITVHAPRSPESKTFTFDKTTKVKEVASKAAEAFGYDGGSPGLQNSSGEVLDSNKPLVAAGVREGDELEITDTAGGVIFG